MSKIKLNEETGFFQQAQTVFERRTSAYKFLIRRYASWEPNGELYVVHFLVCRGEVAKNPYDGDRELPWLRNEKLLYVCSDMGTAAQALRETLEEGVLYV